MKTVRNMTLSVMRIALFLVAALLVSGCSTLPKHPYATLEAPLHPPQDVTGSSVKYAIDVYDPLEGLNRRVYTFNYYFDKFLFLPVVRGYEWVMPDYGEKRVSNFVDNVYEFSNFSNNLLQLKAKRAGITLARFTVNTTVGIGGLWDPATGMNLHEQQEDFGQTLGRYGVGNGPFIVLPILGPSNLRDTTGTLVDAVTFSQVGPPAWVDDEDVTLVFGGMTAVDTRRRQSFRYYQSGSPFEYDLIRMLYSAKRELEVAK